jgi:hypothetical protein
LCSPGLDRTSTSLLLEVPPVASSSSLHAASLLVERPNLSQAVFENYR